MDKIVKRHLNYLYTVYTSLPKYYIQGNTFEVNVSNAVLIGQQAKDYVSVDVGEKDGNVLSDIIIYDIISNEIYINGEFVDDNNLELAEILNRLKSSNYNTNIYENL